MTDRTEQRGEDPRQRAQRLAVNAAIEDAQRRARERPVIRAVAVRDREQRRNASER